jgi:hypothetical protein
LRSIEAAEDLSLVSPNGPVYYEPAPLVAVSDHKTLEVETVKLAENIDPRKLATEMRLGRVSSSLVPPSDSGWPPETALSSSTPPDRPGRRRRLAPLVLCGLLGALLVLVLARAATRRSANIAGTPIATAAAVVAPPQSVSAEIPAQPATSATQQANAATPPTNDAAPLTNGATPLTNDPLPAASESARAASNAPRHSTKHSPPLAAREPLATPSSSKPKRAIY